MNRRSGKKGYVLLTGAATAVGLITFTGLAFDTGYIQLQKSKIQSAADAAVTGAVAESSRTPGVAAMTQAAKQASAANGFAHGKDGVTVTLTHPPAGGPYAGNSRWVEARVTQNTPTFFMKILGVNDMNIAARSVAKAGGPGDACVFALNATMSAAFDLNGTGQVDSCGIVVNSNHTYAANINGNYTMNLSSFQVHGGVWLAGGSMSWGAGSYPVTGSKPMPDPLWYVEPPTVPNGCDYVRTQFKGGGTKKATLYPGVYCDGISISSGWDITFMPGTYILKGGGLDSATTANLIGSDVTFYNTQGSGYSYAPITINGNTVSTLKAPTSGPLEGILFFQDRSIVGTYHNYIRGASNFTLNGALYFKTQALEVRGTSSHKYTILVADSIEISGTTEIKADYTELANGNPMLSKTIVFGE